MKLQIALDDITLDAALKQIDDLAEYIDIIETGTPFLLEYGLEAVRAMRRAFPYKEIFCDAKIMDGGRLEAASAFQAGADYVTVMAIADSATISAVIEEGRAWNGQVVVDLLCVNDFASALPGLIDLGVDMVAVHVGVDQQLAGRSPLNDLIKIKSIAKDLKVAVAGGISLCTLSEYIGQRPDVIIMGSALCHAPEPRAIAAKVHAKLQRGA